MALLRLDEPARALAQFAVVEADMSDRRMAGMAGLLRAWAHLKLRDEEAFAASVLRLDVESAARLRLLAVARNSDRDAFAAAHAAWQVKRSHGNLVDRAPGTAHSDPLESSAVRARFEAYDRARHTKRPWLGGIFSAVIPGLGQAYAGSAQAAGVAFVLNAIFITATVELVDRGFYATAVAAGTAASFFYVGNVINAVDLLQRRNDRAADGPYEDLERLLVPEAHP